MKKSTFATAVAVAAGVTTAAYAAAPPALVEYAAYSIVHTLPNGGEIRSLVQKVDQQFKALEKASGPQSRKALEELKQAVDALERALDDAGLENKIRLDLQRLLTSIRSAMPGDGSVREGDGSVRRGDGSVRQGDGSVRPEEMGALRGAVRNLVAAYGK